MSSPSPFHRQVHLDFHTSEHCTDVGGAFDEGQFVDALRAGNVNSINLFAQCHHGWIYYHGSETGWEHPHLETDLLGRMVAACREAKIHPVIYITVSWNDKAAREHPDWVIRNMDGSKKGLEPQHPDTARPWGWDRLCLNTPYVEESVLRVTEEVMDLYQPDGMWYDITGEQVCTCGRCQASMRQRGLDWRNPRDQATFGKEVYRSYLERTNGAVHKVKPEAAIYHNSGLSKGRHDLYPFWSHYELESLPTGGWGYDFFPPNARYYNQLGDKLVIGMTGKFHRSWGEFGGFKKPQALRWEVAQMGALGCLSCVGDQMHPSGAMDVESYRLIGSAYHELEAREPYLNDARIVGDIAIVIPNGSIGRTDITGEPSELGASQMLMELHVPHQVIDSEASLEHYKLLILPDTVSVDDSFAAKLNDYLDGGGALLLSGESGLDPDKVSFQVDIGGRFDGHSPWDVEYTKAGASFGEGMVTSPFLMRYPGCKVAIDDGETLAEAWQPYFSRTYGHFCSHLNTPHEKPTGWPAVLRKGSVIYCAHKVFKDYSEFGMGLHRDLIENCIRLLDPEPDFTIRGFPSAGRVSLTEQSGEGRLLVHLLYASPIKRGATEVIDDIVPLQDIELTLRADRPPSAVFLADGGQTLEHQWASGQVTVRLPRLELYALVVLQY